MEMWNSRLKMMLRNLPSVRSTARTDRDFLAVNNIEQMEGQTIPGSPFILNRVTARPVLRAVTRSRM